MLLEVHDVRKRYGGFNALTGVELAVPQSRVHGLIGPNGAGKTTLVDIITGRTPPSSGKVYLHGRAITNWSGLRRTRAGIGRSFQRISIFPELSVAQQVLLSARSERRAKELLELFQLTDVAGSPASQLPYGLQRRVDVAMAAGVAKRLLVLDEPAAGLSADESAELATLLRGLVDEFKLSMLLIEHDMDMVFALCDEITVLHLGGVVACGDVPSIRKDAVVRSVYLGAEAAS
ncbi:ABC transporter ATP-binding protein [Nocardioides sp.]|uniref:ABC transporter ATP-binding protein n=1 Tax=Nocardioides sp. TaxID=35761 RepID=UPI00262AE4E4|nr:ABC transporter ATP-binding protein [Nocardioides sp.]MDI6912497.1 ABC transporter ATP-binding protein [Nocardioides sp.]